LGLVTSGQSMGGRNIKAPRINVRFQDLFGELFLNLKDIDKRERRRVNNTNCFQRDTKRIQSADSPCSQNATLYPETKEEIGGQANGIQLDDSNIYRGASAGQGECMYERRPQQKNNQQLHPEKATKGRSSCEIGTTKGDNVDKEDYYKRHCLIHC
jgi:hypothetical protein